MGENPDQKNSASEKKRENKVMNATEVIRTAEPNEQRTTTNRLNRINPELGVLQCEGFADIRQPSPDGQESQEDCHGQNVSD